MCNGESDTQNPWPLARDTCCCWDGPPGILWLAQSQPGVRGPPGDRGTEYGPRGSIFCCFTALGAAAWGGVRSDWVSPYYLSD